MKNTRQKGRRFVKKALEVIKQYFSDAYEVVGSGQGLEKGDIRIPHTDLVIEAKNHKTISMASWVTQSEREGLGYNKCALLWRHPKSPRDNPDMRVDISLDFFMELLKRYSEPVVKSDDREMKYSLYRLKEACNSVLKKL